MQVKMLIKANVKKMKQLLMLITGLGLFYAGSVFASSSSGDAPAGSIGAVAENVQDSFGAIAKVITSGAYIAGMGFVLGAIFKFKAHKDNPTQIPIGTPIALLFIGAAMIFLPTIFSVAGTTLFTSQGSIGGVSGTSTFGNFSS